MVTSMVARRAAATITLALVGALALVASPATADTSAANPATPTGEQRQAEVAAMQREAADLEARRLRELRAEGLSAAEAAEALDAEQLAAAADIRKRIMERPTRV